MKNLIANIKIILSPSYWVMNMEYCEEVDLLMIELLNNYEFKNIDIHTADLGGHILWIENIPYCCMWFYRYKHNEFRPSRKTIYKAVKKLEKNKQENLLNLIKNNDILQHNKRN